MTQDGQDKQGMPISNDTCGPGRINQLAYAVITAAAPTAYAFG